MLRLAIRITGHLLLAATALCVVVSFRDHAAGEAAALRFQADMEHVVLLGGAWLACLVLVAMLDFVEHLRRPAVDPYEDHPKMSPSVQPAYLSYDKLKRG